MGKKRTRTESTNGRAERRPENPGREPGRAGIPGGGRPPGESRPADGPLPGRPRRWRPILIALAGVLLLVGSLGGIKAAQIRAMIEQGKKFVPPPETVTTAVAKTESWETSLTAVGSLTAVQGVTVSAELPGKVVEIAFEPGKPAAAGELLVRQDASAEEALLPGAVAQVALAKANLDRTAGLLAERIASQADHDAAVAAHDRAKAEADSLRAAIEKKRIRAPFSGRLGIRRVNLGQILREGDPVVTLQSLDPIFADFSLPQQQLGSVRIGLPVRVESDAMPGRTLSGRITAIDPVVDASTRNGRLQATLSNPGEVLRPGMFVTLSVSLPGRRTAVSIPATAVLPAPYGDSVFVVEDDGAGKGGKVLRQRFVRLGARRGDFVEVTQGLKAGERVASTGVFKLRNGQPAVVDERLAPPFRKDPKPENS